MKLDVGDGSRARLQLHALDIAADGHLTGRRSGVDGDAQGRLLAGNLLDPVAGRAVELEDDAGELLVLTDANPHHLGGESGQGDRHTDHHDERGREAAAKALCGAADHRAVKLPERRFSPLCVQRIGNQRAALDRVSGGSPHFHDPRFFATSHGRGFFASFPAAAREANAP